MTYAGVTKISGVLVLAMTFACAGLAGAGETAQAAVGKVQVLSGGTGAGAREKLAERQKPLPFSWPAPPRIKEQPNKE